MQYDDRKALAEALRRCAVLFQESILMAAVIAERDEEIAALKAAASAAATAAPKVGEESS